MSFILTAIGTLLFLLCLAGISFGVFMAVDHNTREAGWHFALGWVPAVAAAGGVLMRDTVTFAVGLLCFLISGAVFYPRGGKHTEALGTAEGPDTQDRRVARRDPLRL